MPYEDDYKMWLEKMLIEMNPDWVCDGMADKEFTHDWCEEYCGKDNAYITPKCLHMYYHHIARADRKTEPQTELVNDSPILVKDLVDDEFNPYDEECMRCKHLKLKCEFVPSYCKYEPRDEQTERSE